MTDTGRTIAMVLTLSMAATSAAAETRWAIVICGASGGPKYAEQMQAWRTDLQGALVDRYGFDVAHVKQLVDETVKTGEVATADNVRKVFAEIRKTATKDDMVLVVLFGHGTAEGDAAKFNLVGPDLTAGDWAQLLNTIPARLALVNTTEASFPFLDALKAKGRVVVTATNSAAQKYSTVFPEYFVKAMREASTDLDKNGRTSILEVFSATSLAVKQYYEQRGQLTTERSLLDDTGDGIGREAEGQGADGSLARLWYLDAEVAAATTDPELAELLRRRRALETQAEELKLKKDEMPPQEWDAAFEKLMVELAQVSQAIKKKS
jgi:hypothetical protein